MNVLTRGMRNAFRNGIRTFSITVILSLSIALALAMVLARSAVQKKIDSVKSTIGNTITISPAGVKGFEGGGEPLKNEAIDGLKNIAHISAVTKTLHDQLSSENTSLQSAIDAGTLGKRFRQNSGGEVKIVTPGAEIMQDFKPPIRVSAATDLNASPAASDGKVTLISGALFNAGTAEHVAIVGKALAEKNNLSTGSTFTAYGNTITVVGIYDTGTTFENSGLVMPLATLQKLSGQTGQLSSAIVTVDSIANVEAVLADIKGTLGDTADITSQQAETESALAPLENIKSISLFSLIGAIVAGAVIILLTMIMIVRERRREIGVLKAIGASNITVMTQFVAEAVTFTIIAAAIGIIFGIAGGNPITRMLVNNTASGTTPAGQVAGGPSVGGTKPLVRMEGPQSFTRNLGFNAQDLKSIQAVVGWSVLLYGLAAALLIALAGSATAALLIAKIRPAEVMRG